MTGPEARYVERTLSGAEYVRYMLTSESDRGIRSAFQQLVLQLAPPGGALFDFGAGPGIDARFFAERGFTLRAYDIDSRMSEYFVEYCRELIEAGRVVLERCSYREFLGRSPPDSAGRFDLVISNFAPLNLVDDLPALFAKFHDLTGPAGKILASALNPYFVQEMRSRLWWRTAPRLWRAGHYFMPGPQAPHHRRSLANFARLSAPHFRLTRAFRSRAPAAEQPPTGVDVSRGSRSAWLHLARSRYMFLLFEKQQPQASA
jgi:SAM-dependent methyltransferase